MTAEPPIVKLVNSVIAQAVDDGASDIHFEPQAKELVMRFRLDGVLHEIMSVPRRMQNGVIIAASRSWPTSTSPNAACRRTAASAWWSAASRIDMRVGHAADRLRREDRHAPARQDATSCST